MSLIYKTLAVVLRVWNSLPATARGLAGRAFRIGVSAGVAYAVRSHAPLDPHVWVGAVPVAVEAAWRMVVVSPEETAAKADVVAWLRSEAAKAVTAPAAPVVPPVPPAAY